MKIQIIQDEQGSELIISQNLPETEDESPSCEDMLLAAINVIMRIYSQRSVINAWKRIDPDRRIVIEEEGR